MLDKTAKREFKFSVAEKLTHSFFCSSNSYCFISSFTGFDMPKL